MKKNIFNVLVVLLALCCLFVGCDNPANSGGDKHNENEEVITAGWYKFIYPDISYEFYYINIDGEIERMGSRSKEYSNEYVEKEKNNGINYYTLKHIATDEPELYKFFITDTPSWAVEKISAGWYSYTTNANSNNQHITIFYINADGEIERAGSQTNEYSGTQLETLQNQFSYSICTEKANNSTYIEFNLTEPPVWADNTSADNPNNDDSDGETDIPSEDEEPEITLPTGYEWWCFKGAYVDGMDCFVLYDNNGTPVKTGSNDSEDKTCLYLHIKKSQAINNFMGIRYQITDLTQLPSWALQ